MNTSCTLQIVNTPLNHQIYFNLPFFSLGNSHEGRGAPVTHVYALGCWGSTSAATCNSMSH